MPKRAYVARTMMLLFCAACYLHCVSQVCYDDDDCGDPLPQQQSRRQKLKDDAIRGLNKALVYISYLNYSDRTTDRVFTGPAEFEPYRGKKIRRIEIKIIDPFGVSLEHPIASHYTRFRKFANSIQFKTREWAVKNELLFKAGERVVPIQFADTEKNLWQGGTFKDLKIYMIPVDSDDDAIDVLMVLQDRWSWSISTGAQYNKAQLGISFNNFLGMPQSISQKISFNYRKDNPYTVYGGYEYDNIKRTHVSISSDYQYENLNKGGELQIWRDFFSVNTRWAGHAFAGVYREAAAVPNELAQAIPTNIFYNYEDGWLAGSFKLPEQKESLRRIIVAARVYRVDYINRPFMISSDTSQMFVNHLYALGGIGLANWNYYVDHSVFGLGNAEYFSKGFNISFVGGYDDDEELGKRFYSGVDANYGGYVNQIGYLNTKITYSGYLDKYAYNQLLGKWTNQFFSAPVDLGRKFFMRQFINTLLSVGFDRPSDREIAMNNYNGVRGIYVNYIRGSRTYVFNFETDIYPRFKVLGFSSDLFVLANIALVQQNSYTGGQLCQGYGAGIRLRNLSLGVGFFEFTFVYYPSFSIPGYKSYSLLATTDNLRGIPKDNLFSSGVLTPEFPSTGF
jgi:hypothetical protein